MFIYEFEKGEIRTGIAIDLGTDDQKMFEERYGKFINVYNDNQHTKELEFVYAFMKAMEEDDFEDEYELILTKDKDKILEMELSDKYELADMHFVLAMCEGNVPINFYCLDGYCTLTIEQYIVNGKRVYKSNYISVNLIQK